MSGEKKVPPAKTTQTNPKVKYVTCIFVTF